MSNKKDWGGSRKGASRPRNPYPRQTLVIAATPEEKAQIEAALTTRERAEILLKIISQKAP